MKDLTYFVPWKKCLILNKSFYMLLVNSEITVLETRLMESILSSIDKKLINFEKRNSSFHPYWKRK